MREIYPLAHELETRGTHHTLWLCGAATNEPLQYLHAFTDVTVYRRQRSAVENPRCVVPRRRRGERRTVREERRTVRRGQLEAAADRVPEVKWSVPNTGGLQSGR